MKAKHNWIDNKCSKCNMTREASLLKGLLVYKSIIGRVIKIGREPECTTYDKTILTTKNLQLLGSGINDHQNRIEKIENKLVELKAKIKELEDEKYKLDDELMTMEIKIAKKLDNISQRDNEEGENQGE